MIERTVTLQIEILNRDSLPIELLTSEDFIDWIKCIAVETGTGKQCEYYSDEDYSIYKDVEVLFYVKPK